MKELLSNRVFLLVTISDFIQNLAIWIRNMALLFFIVEQTNSNPIYVSALTFAEYLPIFVFSIIGGVLADRWRPKQTMIWGDITSLLSIIVILILVQQGYWQGVFLITIISAIVSQFSQPSTFKIIKQSIPNEQIQKALGFTQSFMSLFIIFGPMIGTAIYHSLGIQISLYCLLILFSLSAICLAFLPVSHKEPHKKSSFSTDLIEGIHYIRQSQQLSAFLIVFAILAFGVGLVQPLDLYLITDRLQLPKESLQWFTALAGVGMLVGGIIAVTIPSIVNKKQNFFVGLFILGISTIIEVFSISVILTGALRFITAVFLSLMQTALTSFVLSVLDDTMVGRFTGIMNPIFTGFMLVGTMLSGFYMINTSLITVYVTAGLVIIIASLLSIKIKLSLSEADKQTMANS